MKRTASRILILCLVLSLLMCGGAAEASAGAKSASAALEEVRALIDAGKLYEAAVACDAGIDGYPDSKSKFLKLWDEIADACEAGLPKTGELERTFRYQGGNELRISAKSGNVEMTAAEVSSKGREHVRFFIRKGESITVHLPSGEYALSFRIGDVWFDDKVGFGEFCGEYAYEENLAFKYTAGDGCVTYYYFDDVL